MHDLLVNGKMKTEDATNMVKELLIAVFLLIGLNTFSQNFNKIFIPFSNYGKQNYTLTIVDDSFLRLSSIPSHISRAESVIVKYNKFEDSISFQIPETKFMVESLNNKGLTYFIGYKARLIKTDFGFKDLQNRTLYIPARKYYKGKNSLKSIIIVDKRKYVNRAPKTSGYGIVVKDGRISKGLKKVINNIMRDSSYYNVRRLDVFEAYKRFGLIGLNGVLEYSSR